MKKLIIISLLLFIPFIVGASFDRSLYYGLQSDPQVKELQDFLTDQGFYSGNITGNFFSLTLKAVKKFQAKEKLPQTGYFGSFSRQRANAILASSITESDREAINETGTSTPPVESPKTTNDVVKSIQDQIALLTQQIALLQQIQQNTQQIVQNTTSTSACATNWQCSSWGSCINSQKTRTCGDYNNCGVTTGKPSEIQSCTSTSTPTLFVSCLANPSSVQINQHVTFISSVTISGGTGNYTYSWTGDCIGYDSNCSKFFSQTGTKTATLTVSYGGQTQTVNCSVIVGCAPNWSCDSWSGCVNDQQTRTCVDVNNCGILTGKPIELQSCVCSPNWQCANWSQCNNGQQTRVCTDTNSCGVLTRKPNETLSCGLSSILQDGFNAYASGSIIGWGGWQSYSNGSNFNVQEVVSFEDTKAIYNNTPGDSVIYKKGTALSSGRQAFYIRAENRSNWLINNNRLYIRVTKGPWWEPFCSVRFEKDGNVSYYDGVHYNNFATYNDNEWIFLEIEWRSSDSKASYRINDEAWTDWDVFSGSGSFVNFDYVGLDFESLGGSGGVYIDNLY